MKTKQSLISNLRLLGPCFLLGFLLTPVMAVGQATYDSQTAIDRYIILVDAAEGIAEAQYAAGLLYFIGNGVPEDYAEAVKWYRLAAAQGYAPAQSTLGLMYALGRGIPQNDTQAAAWYILAADQGDAFAQLSLGFMYAQGKGVAADIVLAYAWFNIAVASGQEDAADARSFAAKQMNSAQIAEAQKLSTVIFEIIQKGN